MVGHRFVAVVGARALPEGSARQVAAVVRYFVEHGWGVGTGGARGADQYALEAVVASGRPACTRSVVFLPGPVGAARTAALAGFQALGGRVVAGSGVGRGALLGRSARLARASSGVVAFLWGASRGSVFTVREALRAGKRTAVVLAGGGAGLPGFAGGHWAACPIGGVAAHRWVPDVGGPDGGEPKLTALGRIFVVPDGEPVQGLLGHVSTLSQGERLWFERGIVAGDTVLIPHEALSDTPAFLLLHRHAAGVPHGLARGAGGDDRALIYMVSCCARSTILHSRMDLEVGAVRSVLGREAPIFGSYAGGEIAPLPSHYGDAADAGREFSGSLYHDHRVPARSLWSQARPGGRSLVTSISTTRSGDRREG
jgi:hypothetical protein